jgi:hypothetical protein
MNRESITYRCFRLITDELGLGARCLPNDAYGLISTNRFVAKHKKTDLWTEGPASE